MTRLLRCDMGYSGNVEANLTLNRASGLDGSNLFNSVRPVTMLIVYDLLFREGH